jgi:hypothetical protein
MGGVVVRRVEAAISTPAIVHLRGHPQRHGHTAGDEIRCNPCRSACQFSKVIPEAPVRALAIYSCPTQRIALGWEFAAIAVAMADWAVGMQMQRAQAGTSGGMD